MRKLIEGHRRYLADVFPSQRELFAKLAEGQSPAYLFITCSDSRVQPSAFTGADPGDLFVERSLGNIVPAPGGRETEGAAVIEYAVEALGVRHVIVCGHSRCGAMNALLNPASLQKLPTVAAWIDHAGSTREAVARKHPHLKGDDLLAATVRENVLVQLEHLGRYPSVATRLADGRLQTHGWVYEFEHGRVVAYDPRAEAFVPLEDAYPPETPGPAVPGA